MPDDLQGVPRDIPDDPIMLPSDEQALLRRAGELVEQCRSTAGTRAAYGRLLHRLTETGRYDGSPAAINMMFAHLDRLASHLFSPSELKFSIGFKFHYPQEYQKRAALAARMLTDDWNDNSTDLSFSQGVFEGLKYGACILKQWPESDEDGNLIHRSSLIMPWAFGVYRESINSLARQPVLCESVRLSLPEVWRRIYNLPNARDLFRKIRNQARKGATGEEHSASLVNMLSTAPLNLTATGNVGSASMVRAGGLLQLSADASSFAAMGPSTDVELVTLHELWVWGLDGYRTIQFIEPNILIEPRVRQRNLLAAGLDGQISEELKHLQPFTLIQPNPATNYIWGRSELADLQEPQGLLAMLCDDARRLIGLQIDKQLGFMGDGITDETYDQFRSAGFFAVPSGVQVQDLTAKFPSELLPLIDKSISVIEMLGGFDNALSGKGEPGVRSGNHANMLMRTASPRLRDRSLLVERQCAIAADFWLRVMEAKDGRRYWTDGQSEEAMQKTSFILSDLPEDRRVTVDSHSSSPIFQGDHQQLIAWGLGNGVIDKHYAIDNLPYPHRDAAHASLTERDAQQAAMMKELMQKDPEALTKILEHQRGGKK